MKRDKARTLFEAGALIACDIAPLFNGYVMNLTTRDGRQEPLETARKGDTRQFRTLDAAAREAATIGFKDLRVRLD